MLEDNFYETVTTERDNNHHIHPSLADLNMVQDSISETARVELFSLSLSHFLIPSSPYLSLANFTHLSDLTLDNNFTSSRKLALTTPRSGFGVPACCPLS